MIRNLIRDFWEREHLEHGYQLVCTPHIAREELWKTSGHLDYYKEHMYLFEKDSEGYVVKPMNCPFHIQIFKSKPRSYRELPIRYAEWGTVYRYERSGTLHGLMRVRGFTLDDAHIFCTAEQVKEEMPRILDFTRHTLGKFGFSEYRIRLSTRDPQQREKYMGSEENWNLAQNALAEALRAEKMPYTEVSGEAVFYGPKIDIDVVDAAGREWQCTTIQFDFNLPKQFGVTYVGADGNEHEVIMFHRALLGAIERFFAVLIEHTGGNLPTWLAPTQVVVLPLTTEWAEYAEQANRELHAAGLRSELDNSTETISYRIRQAELRKIPYMAVCGKREAESRGLAIRRHGAGKIGSLTVKELVETIEHECNNSPMPTR